LLAEAVGRTIESVEARLAEVQQQLLDMEPQLSVAQQAVADARREFLAIDGTAEAAELREEAESPLARCGTMPKVMRVFDWPGLC
jgi:aerobic-type carbon monoxide dehydrogenase small subunit (CoxS/CutS family)